MYPSEWKESLDCYGDGWLCSHDHYQQSFSIFQNGTRRITQVIIFCCSNFSYRIRTLDHRAYVLKKVCDFMVSVRTLPWGGGCPQILMYLSYFGWFLKYLRENWPPIGGQKILSISVKFLEANSFRNSNPFQKFRLRRHSKPEYFVCT